MQSGWLVKLTTHLNLRGQEEVERYLQSPYMPSWRQQGKKTTLFNQSKTHELVSQYSHGMCITANIYPYFLKLTNYISWAGIVQSV